MTREVFENLEDGDKIIFIESVKENVFDYWIVDTKKFNEKIQGASVLCNRNVGKTWTEITVNDCGSYELLEVIYKTHAEYFV